MAQGRGNFVWLDNQAHDHNAMFMTIHGAPLRRPEEPKNRWVMARGQFIADEKANATLRITCDGKYRLWINGNCIGHGPYRSNPSHQILDSYEIGKYLVAGKNQIAVLIHVPGQDLAWYETNKSAWQVAFGDGGLFVQTDVSINNTTKTFNSDETWKIKKSNAWTEEIALSGWGQDFIEEINGSEIEENWNLLDLDDNHWPNAKLMRAEPTEEVKARGWGPIEPFPILIPSKTLPLKLKNVHPSKFEWAKSVVPQKDLPIKERLYSEELIEPKITLSENCDALVLGTGSASVRSDGDYDTALLFSFSPYQTGRPFIDFTAKGGEIIEIAVSEAMPGEFGRGIINDGLRNEGKLWVAHICRYIAKAGRQRFDKFNPTGFRAMQIVVRGAHAGIEIHEIGMTATHQNVDLVGSFECSDTLLNKIWEIGRHTVLMCAQDGWIDCPGRESRQWLGDGIVMFDMAQYGFGPSIYPMHQQFLRQICEGQRADGLARMVSPGDIKSNSITIPDYTFHWIIGTAKYYLWSGDISCIKQSMPFIEKALGWCELMRDETYLIKDVPEWHFIEWANIDRNGYSMPFNALYAGALSAAAQLADAIGNPIRARELEADFHKVRQSLNELHYNAQKAYYVDSVCPYTLKQGTKISQHANALALLFDIAPKDLQNGIMATITDTKRLKLTDAPPIMANCGNFDDAVNIVKCNSFFAHFVYDGIAKMGGAKWAIEDIKTQFGAMIATGTTTLWEAFEPIASLCHGFSATPIYQLSHYGLGVRALSAGFCKFTIEYSDCGLEWVKGKVPTVNGNINVEWRKIGKQIIGHINFPENCEFIDSNKCGKVQTIAKNSLQITLDL